jgi:hypothetical protein
MPQLLPPDEARVTAERLLARYGPYGAGQVALSMALRLYGDKSDDAKGKEFWAQVMLEINHSCRNGVTQNELF